MKFAILFEVPVEVGNVLEKDPKAFEGFAKLLEQLKPEAAYFGATRRLLILITHAESHEDLAKLLVPFWHTFKTYPQVEPVASLDEYTSYLLRMSEFLKGL